MSSPQRLHNVPYGTHPLQTYDVTILDSSPSPAKLWIIYIHGGAWRDPRITSSSFSAASHLLESSPHIAALASLNYRLSPHPDFPSATQTARHPDHIADVLAALAALQRAYGFGTRYVLVGHSAGATLALQACMSRAWTGAGGVARYAADGAPVVGVDVVPPVAVVGVEGIYDLPLLVERNAHPAYRAFVTGAFGAEEGWAAASPVAGDYTGTTWPLARLVVLAHSREDELVGWEQVDAMSRRLKHRGWSTRVGEGSAYEELELKGKHDEVWEDGRELARAIEYCLDKVVGLQ